MQRLKANSRNGASPTMRSRAAVPKTSIPSTLNPKPKALNPTRFTIKPIRGRSKSERTGLVVQDLEPDNDVLSRASRASRA